MWQWATSPSFAGSPRTRNRRSAALSAPCDELRTPLRPARSGTEISFLRRRLRTLPRRQRDDVGGDRRTVGGVELGGVADRLDHRAAGEITGRIHAVVEETGDVFRRPGDILLRPMLQPDRGDVRHPALAVRTGSAGKARAGDDGAEKIARAVAFGAVPGAVDQISAAIPLRRLRRIASKRPAVEIQHLPESDQAADIE